MNSKKYVYKLIASVMLLAIAVIPLIPSSVFAATVLDQNTVMYEENYESNLINDDILYDNALNGDCVNDKYTTVTVTEDPDNGKVVTIKKLLKKQNLRSGATIESYSTRISGDKHEFGTEGASTVSMTVGIKYDKQTFNGLSCYKMTSYYNTCNLLDSRFRLYSVNQTVTASGQGYTSGGTAVYVNENNSFTVSYPNSGTNNSRSTGFTKYLTKNDGSGGGSKATLKYQRVDTSQIYSFPLGVDL